MKFNTLRIVVKNDATIRTRQTDPAREYNLPVALIGHRLDNDESVQLVGFIAEKKQRLEALLGFDGA